MVVAALSAAACGGGTAGLESSEGGPTTISIAGANYPIAMNSLPLIVARDQGFLEDEGINLKEIVASSGGGTPLRNLISADLPIAIATPSAAALARMADQPVLIVGGNAQSASDILLTSKPGSGVESMADVPGTSVGYSSEGSVTHLLLNLALAREGIDPATVDMQAFGGIQDSITALQTDAVTSSFSGDPIFGARTPDLTIVSRMSDYAPRYAQEAIITTEEVAESNPEVIRSFLRAMQTAMEWIGENPEAAADLWAAESDLDAAALLDAIRTALANDYWSVGLDAEGLSAVAEAMTLTGLLDEGQSAPWSELIDQSLLPDGTPEIDAEEVGK